MLADALTKALWEVKFAEIGKSILIQDTHPVLKQVLLNSCLSKRMQSEDKHKALD